MSRRTVADSYIYICFLARQPAVTVVAIKFHTREANRCLFKIPMRAYTRRSISAFSEITARDITHKSHTQIAPRFVEMTNFLTHFFSVELAARASPRT